MGRLVMGRNEAFFSIGGNGLVGFGLTCNNF